MQLHLVLVVDESEDVVSGNGVTAVTEDVHADGFFGDHAGNLLVEVFSNDQQSAVHRDGLLVLLFPFYERNIFSPACLLNILLGFATQFIEVFLTVTLR